MNAGLAVGFVIQVYIPTATRRLPRGHPKSLVARLITVTIYSGFASLIFAPWLSQSLGLCTWNHIISLQRWHFGVMPTLRSLLLVVALFNGPLIKDWPPHTSKGLEAIRDYLIGPLAEEIVFRGAGIALYEAANSLNRGTVESSLLFGLAHCHHGVYAWYRGMISLKRALVLTIAHILMTTTFGILASEIATRTGSIWASFFVHSFCNWVGPPDLNGPAWYWASLVAGIVSFFAFITHI